MFDPDSVGMYKLFHGDAVHVLLDFKPNSIHSGFATPGLMSYGSEKIEPWQDFFGYRAQWFQLLYDALRYDGSFFMAIDSFHPNDGIKQLVEMMDRIGWINQRNTGFGDAVHWTKSDDFYENYIDEPPAFQEDFGSFMEKTNTSMSLQYPVSESDRVNVTSDRICRTYTPPGGITLEPTVGYGRHIAAALQRDRRVIGIDWDRMSLVVCARRASMLGKSPFMHPNTNKHATRQTGTTASLPP